MVLLIYNNIVQSTGGKNMEYYKNGKFNCAELNYRQVKKLVNMEIGLHVITKEDIDKIIEILNLDEINDVEELRAVRNSVVLYLGDYEEIYGEFDEKKSFQIMTNISGITAVIDDKMFRLGGIY